MPNTPNWHDDVFFGIHYDLHANANDTELGRELTREHLRAMLERIRPDWIQCDCKGHPGYTSWPTEVGSPSPGIVADALRVHSDVTRELGIRLGMHYSGVLDARAVELHPEWSAIDAEGNPIWRTTCRLGAYERELMIPQLVELIDRYDVDGFWVDGDNWGARPCWCERCRDEYTRRTGNGGAPLGPDDPHWREWLDFHRDLFVEYVTRCAEAVHARKADCLYCSNWMYTLRQPEAVTAPVDYLSGDFMPNWGAQRAALETRFMQARGLSWDLMAWGFTFNQTDGRGPAIMKPATMLCQELSEVLAQGGASMVYMKPRRSGWLVGWEHEILAQAADFCRARREASFATESASEAAVLHLAEAYYRRNSPLFNYGSAIRPVEGALHALLETGRTADVVARDRVDTDLDRYRLVVLPQQEPLDDDLVARLTAFAEGGGWVVASGDALSRHLPEFVGADPDGEPSDKRIALESGDRAIQLMPPWQRVTPREGTDVVRRRLVGVDPVKGLTDDVVITRRRVGRGGVLSIHGPVFADYFLGHNPSLRTLLAELIDDLDIDWSLRVEAPWWLEASLRTKDGRTIVHLVNRSVGHGLNDDRTIVESIPPVEDVRLELALAQRPTDVRPAPAGAPLDWSWRRGRLRVRVPRVEIHLAVVVEE